MNIFILEDNEDRISAFHAVLAPQHKLTVKQWLGGADGAFAAYQPPYELMLLDHDLGGEQYVSSAMPETGWQFAKFLKSKRFRPLMTIVHSWNVEGARNMESLLRRTGWNVLVWSYDSKLLRYLANLTDESFRRPPEWPDLSTEPPVDAKPDEKVIITLDEFIADAKQQQTDRVSHHASVTANVIEGDPE